MNSNTIEKLKYFKPSSEQEFTQYALKLFSYQYTHNKVYNQWCNYLNKTPQNVTTLNNIPFLPISFFKTHEVICFNREEEKEELEFNSSGTTQNNTSKHYVKNANIYQQSFLDGFTQFYGDIKNWCILGLLPSYLQQGNSSLVYMVNDLIKKSTHNNSGFYLYNFNELAQLLQQLEAQKQKTLLIGVTYALLDFANEYPMPLQHTIVMETGGMKGRKKEMLRAEVHDILKTQFKASHIHSEYGMTELLSQAYLQPNQNYACSKTMKVLVRTEDDPLQVNSFGKGILNIIDLANLHSCSFIATDDVGTLYPNGEFEVLGRLDNSDLRGCSLMYL